MGNNGITIVIPVYNRAMIVGRTLDSICKQSYRPLNIILVDNNSTDDTYRVLENWKSKHNSDDFRITLLREEMPGACNARNRGLASVATEWTMFFDSDDVMLPDHVERAMSFAEKHPDAEVVGWDIKTIGLDGCSYVTEFTVQSMAYNNIMLSTMATLLYMARTSLFRTAGGWRPDLGLGDDVELADRMLAYNPKCYKIVAPEVTVVVNKTDDSISNSVTDRAEQACRYLNIIRERGGVEIKRWCDFRLLMMLAHWAGGCEESKRKSKAVLSSYSGVRKIVWLMLYNYMALGGRGALKLHRLITKEGTGWLKL